MHNFHSKISASKSEFDNMKFYWNWTHISNKTQNNHFFQQNRKYFNSLTAFRVYKKSKCVRCWINNHIQRRDKEKKEKKECKHFFWMMKMKMYLSLSSCISSVYFEISITECIMIHRLPNIIATWLSYISSVRLMYVSRAEFHPRKGMLSRTLPRGRDAVPRFWGWSPAAHLLLYLINRSMRSWELHFRFQAPCAADWSVGLFIENHVSVT